MRIMATAGTMENLEEQIRESGNNYDLDAIRRAYEFAKKAHDGQMRRSGQPYIIHPVCVAGILVELGMDTDSLIAAMLHDVVEDTPVELEDIRRGFGAGIARLVDGVTKLSKIPYVSREEQQAENIRKMLIAMDEDIRVIIIKLADRLHNMRTLDSLSEQKQRDIALETLEVFAPIAHRLGIRALKEELEDLAIKHLDPIAYREIEDALLIRKAEREQFLEEIKNRVRERLQGILEHPYVEGRVKSVHGIYRKMFMQGKDFEEIYDIYAVRVIVDTVAECYNVLGIMHDMFNPIPGRFKDYISTPKPNNYQSLHTTVISHEGIPFEIQIRTWEMHHTAEYGIAAHWKYKLGLNERGDSFEHRLAWIRRLLENQSDTDDVEEIVRTIKTDLAPEEVFAITPRGKVITLPSGSTVIDFAYAIHTAVGNKMVGAKVDGRIVPIDYVLKTGEVVEILTSSVQGKGPSKDWLKIVKTSEARNKIRSWYKKEKRPENIAEGRAEIERELARNNIRLSTEETERLLQPIAARQHCASVEDLYATIGYGGLRISKLMNSIKEEYGKIAHVQEAKQVVQFEEPRATKSSEGVVIEGIDNCLIKLARCCNPIPGDPIIGYITRGHGVSVHKRSCSNVPQDTAHSEEPERWISARWDSAVKETFKSTLQILAIDREALLADLTIQLASMHVMIHNVNARELKGGNCQITITLSIQSLEHLKSIAAKLSKVEGVIQVERSAG